MITLDRVRAFQRRSCFYIELKPWPPIHLRRAEQFIGIIDTLQCILFVRLEVAPVPVIATAHSLVSFKYKILVHILGIFSHF